MIYCKGTFFSNKVFPLGNRKKILTIEKVDGFIICRGRVQ